MASPLTLKENQRPGGRPTLLFGGEASWLGSLGGIIESAADHEFYAVDIDLRSAWVAPGWSAIQPSATRNMIRIRSAWIPGFLNGPLAIQRTNRLISFLRGSRNHLGLRTIVVPRAAHIRRGSSIGPHIRQLSTEKEGSIVRIAVGVRALDLGSDRAHLSHLLSIRHLAEEWDLDVALDLTGNVSRDWEAEAAVMRLLPRLALVRLSTVLGDPSNHGAIRTQSIAARTIAILADQGYTGSISLSPGGSLFRSIVSAQGPGTPEITVRDVVLDQYNRRQQMSQAWDSPKRLIPPEVH